MNIFDTRTMLGMVNQADFTPTTFLRDRYFATVRTFDTAKVDVDIVDASGRKLAPFVNPKIGGKVVERHGYRTNTYEAPELSPQMITTAEDMLKRLPGEALYSGMSPTERAAQQLGADLRELDEIITRREEAMCAEALFTGKIAVKGEGYDEVIDFWGADEANKPTTEITTKWSATTADIIGDLRKIRRTVIQKSGVTPTEIVCGSDVIDVLLKDTNVAAALNTRRVDLGMIQIQDLPNGVTYYGNLAGLDIYGYDSWYLGEDGKELPFVPAKQVLFASQAAKTTMAYGCVSLAGDDAVQFYAERRVPDSWVQRANPSGRVVQIKSRPLPIINQVHGFHVITPLA
jgi:hypothetical protein